MGFAELYLYVFFIYSDNTFELTRYATITVNLILLKEGCAEME